MLFFSLAMLVVGFVLFYAGVKGGSLWQKPWTAITAATVTAT